MYNQIAALYHGIQIRSKIYILQFYQVIFKKNSKSAWYKPTWRGMKFVQHVRYKNDLENEIRLSGKLPAHGSDWSSVLSTAAQMSQLRYPDLRLIVSFQ